MDGWTILLQYDTYNRGSLIRHEFGHGVREALHDRICGFAGCSSYNYNFVDGYTSESCEYGSAAFNEGIATFFGIRSATVHDTNVWDCRCRDNNNQGIRSQTSNSLTTPDRVQECANQSGEFVGVGDRWIVSSATCKRLKKASGCNECLAGGDGYCTSLWNGLLGWRNSIQVARFLWDLIDTSTDGGSDNVDYTAGSLITKMHR